MSLNFKKNRNSKRKWLSKGLEVISYLFLFFFPSNSWKGNGVLFKGFSRNQVKKRGITLRN